MDWSSFLNPGTLISITIGIIVAVIVYFKQKRRKEISWAKRSSQIIKSKVSSFKNLRILYKDDDIPDLTVTKIAFWNSGTEAIRVSDIYEDRPIALVFDNHTKVLDVSIIPESNSDNKFGMNQIESKNIIEIKRTCAEKQEGAVVQIIHTGDGGGIELDGAIVEGKIKRTKAEMSDTTKGLTTIISAILFGIAGIIAAITALKIELYSITTEKTLAKEIIYADTKSVALIIPLCIALCIAIISFAIPLFSHSKKIPKSLEKYFF